MCWNADISFNTFLFGFFSLCFIYITNTYSKYKTHSFDHPLVYVFMFAVVSMQLVEYFLWKNLKNKSANRYYSFIAWLIVSIQPLILMLMIQGPLRYILIGLYLLLPFVLPTPSPLNYLFSIKSSSTLEYHTHVGKTGHLVWEWMNSKDPFKDRVIYTQIAYLFFYILSAILIQNSLLTLFVLSTLFISILFYYKDGSFGSMWCWFVNISMIFVLIHILLIQPFLEYNGLC